MPYNATISGWTIISNVAGSCEIDVWRGPSYSIPTIIDTIAGTELPTLSTQQINWNDTLSSWTTSLLVNDVIAFNVNSSSIVTKVTVIIKVDKV